MKPRRFYLAVSAALLLCVNVAASAQQEATGNQAKRHRIFASETMNIGANVALSPNGRWLVLSIMEASDKANLWLQEVGGGAPSRVTTSGHWDANPQWSPNGDRIYFVSNRPAQPGDPAYYLMALPFDAQTGKAQGEPKQVLDDPANSFRISPDGQQIAYFDMKNRRLLKVASASGGAGRLVVQAPIGSGNPAWSRDGQALVFVVSGTSQVKRSIRRVAVGGGEPTVLATDVPHGLVMLGPGAEYFMVMDNTNPREHMVRLMDPSGKVRQTLTLNRNAHPVHFTPDGRAFIAVESNIVAPTRVLSMADGKYQDVTNPIDYYDWPLGFTADNQAIFTWTMEQGNPVLARVSLTDGTKKLYADTGALMMQGANSRYVFSAPVRQGPRPRALVALDTRTNKRYTISRSAHAALYPTGPAGYWGTQEDLLYLDLAGDKVRVNAWSGPGKVHTIRTLPASLLDRSGVAVHGNRVVWQQLRDKTFDLMIAEGSTGEPRKLLSYPETMTNNEIAFSPDGKNLVLHYATAANPLQDVMAIVDVGGATAPRFINTGLVYWYYPRWMPDNSAVVVVGGGAGAEAQIVSVPIQEGAKPVTLTAGDPASKWGFELSHDGKMIAYPHEIWKGSFVWKIELGDVVAAR